MLDYGASAKMSKMTINLSLSVLYSDLFPVNRQARQMLEMAKDATMSVGDVAGLLMDELASLVLTDALDDKLVHWISSTMTESFVSDYVVDIDQGYLL